MFRAAHWQGLRILFRFGRHVVAGERLDRCFVGADAIDVRRDTQLIEQALVIEVLPARSGDADQAQRIEPDFGCSGGKLVAVVGVTGRISQDRLAGIPNAADRIGQSDMAAWPPPAKPSRSSATAFTRSSVRALSSAATRSRRRYSRRGCRPLRTSEISALTVARRPCHSDRARGRPRQAVSAWRTAPRKSGRRTSA